MEKIAILVDTAADIDKEVAEKYDIYTLPLYVNLDGNYLKDREEISPDEFYKWIRENKEHPKTSTASPGDVLEKFEEIKKDGYDKVIAITLNSKFSSTHNLIEMLDVDGLDIRVIDSHTLTMAEGLLAIYARELINQGLGFEEIIEILEAKKKDSRVYFSIESFKYIVEGGRLPKSLGVVGDKLSVKPLLTVNPLDGAFKVLKLARGEKRVLNEFRKLAESELAGVKDYYFFLGHGGYEEGLEKIEEKLVDIIDGARKYFRVQISPTLGANTGPGLFGFGLLKID